jgi:hypothetical protein
MHLKLFIASITALLFIGTNTHGQNNTIGISNNGEYSIDTAGAALSKIKKEWKSLLAAQGVKEELSFFEIRKQNDLASKKNYYMLYSKGTSDNVKICTKLFYKNKKFHLPAKGATITIACIGQATACIPNMVNGRWICGDNPNGKCDKNATGCKKMVSAIE